jgi:meiotically up-regulated gene 157 (Mug157) protein
MNERTWVASLVSDLKTRVKPGTLIDAGRKLSYGAEVHEYTGAKASEHRSVSYETDILIVEDLGDARWIPRVVVECKLGAITTHDALTYSAKAATHKHVHPYVRYGILIGGVGASAIPGRLVRHGAHFDFMATWAGKVPTSRERAELLRVISNEFDASRTLQNLLESSRSSKRRKYTLLHRPLLLS